MSPRSRRIVATALLVVGLAALALAVWWVFSRPSEATVVDAVEPQAGEYETDASTPTGVGKPTLTQSPLLREVLSDHAELAPGEVLGNPDCRLLAGREPAADLALVVVPTDSGARFAVLGGAGEIFGDSLPFVPHRFHVGRRVDGTVVAAVADLRLNSGVYRDPDTPEPVRIYVDGHVAYETNKAWNFGVAPDGSSFYVQEPMAGDASRLLVRNLDSGTEAHFDLGTDYAPANSYDPGYLVRYAQPTGEVMFAGWGDHGRGLYRFYPVEGGKAREIRIGPINPSIEGSRADIVIDDGVFMVRVVSSGEGYFAYSPATWARTGDPETWRIVRRRFGYRDDPTVEDVWSREISLAGYGGTMIESDDGRWLGLNAWDFVLLDAVTGETVFAYPKVDKAAELARLSTVLPSGATIGDVGAVTSASFRGSHLMLYRQIGSTRSCSVSDENPKSGHGQYYDCVADLRRRGLYRTVLDVFDLERLELDSKPIFRVDYDDRDQCAIGDFPLRGLQVREGRLTFLPDRR